MTDVTGTGTDMWYLDIFWVRTSEVTSVDWYSNGMFIFRTLDNQVKLNEI